MNWLRILLSALLSMVWLTPAFAITPLQTTEILNIVAKKTSEKGAPLMIELVNSEGKVAQSVVMKATDPQILEQMSPSHLAEELEAAKASGKYTFKAMAAEKILHFPMESFGFFVSLGAVMTYQLMFEYSQNPLAYEQLLQSQIDPVGQLAFLAFGIASGASSGPFNNLILNNRLNPKVAPFIGYAGMSVGMIASNIVGEIGHTPGLRQCAADLWNMSTRTGKKFQGCDEAHKAWNEKGGGAGLASEWAPGLVSLIATTVVAGGLQSGLLAPAGSFLKTHIMMNGTVQGAVKVVGEMAARQILKVTGIELATLFLPGGMVVKGARIALAAGSFLGQMTLFNGVQHIIDPYFNEAYHDVVDGVMLTSHQKALMTELIAAKQTGWKNTQNLSKELQGFTKSMAGWRQASMSEVLQAQSNWEQALSSFSGMYDKAHMFYSEFVDQIWQKNYGKFKALYESGTNTHILDEVFPMNGMSASNVDPKDLTLYLTSPEKILAGQKERTREVVAFFRQLDPSKLPALSAPEKKKWNDLLQVFESQNPNLIGQAWDEISCYDGIQNPGSSAPCLSRPITTEFRIYLNSLKKSFGKPSPFWLPGQGYLKYYSAFNFKPEDEASLPFQKSFQGLRTATLAESLLESMISGPDIEKGQSLIVERNGFKTVFRPPQIRGNTGIPAVTSEEMGPRSISEFNRTANVFTTHHYSYLVKGGIRSSVLSSDHQTFETWWQTYPERQYMNTWVDYESIYQKNISQLIKHLWLSEDTLNLGPASNSVVTALRQENGMYLMILGELLRDSKKEPALIAKETGNVSRELMEQIQPLGTFLKNTDKLDFSYILQIYRHQAGARPQANLKWQSDFVSSFNKITELIKKIKVQKIVRYDGNQDDLPLSTVSNQEMTDQMKGVQTLIEQTEKTDFSNLTPAQTQVAQICLKALGKNFQELTTLGLIANTVSYRERVLNSGGTYNPRCDLQAPVSKRGGVQAVQQAAAGCPAQELK